MLYHRRKFLLVVCFLIGTLFFRANLPSSATQSHLRTENKKLLPFPPSPADLDRINAEFTDPDQLLLWASQQFPNPSLVQVTSFGPSGLVLLDKMHRLGLLSDIPVITIDTLHLFDETHNLIDRVRRQYPELKLHVYTPKEHRRRQEFDAAYGADLWKTDPDKYGYLTKHEPTERALDDQNARAWVTGRRRSQGGERVQLPFVEYTDGRIKLNPLAMWSYDDVWKYIRKHKVPYNSLHE